MPSKISVVDQASLLDHCLRRSPFGGQDEQGTVASIVAIDSFEEGKTYKSAELQGSYSNRVEAKDYLLTILKGKTIFTLNIFADVASRATCTAEIKLQKPNDVSETVHCEGKFFPEIVRKGGGRLPKGKLLLVVNGRNFTEEVLIQSFLEIEELCLTTSVSETTKSLKLSMSHL